MMRHLRCFFKIALLVALLGVSLNAQGYDFVVGGIYYDYNDDGVSVSVSAPMYSWQYTDVVSIPDTVSNDGQSLTVTAIGDSAFYNCSSLTGVEMPATVTVIGNHAFGRDYKLERVNLPDGVTDIGDSAFWYCSGLTAITFNEGLRSIGDNAFSFCTVLTNLSLPSTVTAIGSEAFAGCWNLCSVTVAAGNPVFDSREGCNALIESATGKLLLGCVNTVIPQGVTTIGKSSFAWSKITVADIPEGVTAIEDYAFDHCYYISQLTLPSTLVTIGYSAFNGAYENLTELRLPDSLVSVGGYAFANCSGLEHIDFGHGLRHIGNLAFFNCSGLTEVDLPESLLSIYDGAFMRCTGLTNFHVPASVTCIGSGIFQACENLSSVTVDADNATFDSREGCNAVIETATNTLVAGCASTTIPETVAVLGNGAFMECIGLETIAIPTSVTVIGDHTFEYCYDMDTITLPPRLQSIGRCAFAGCERLVYMDIPSKVTSILDSAFYDCPWLEHITLGRELTFIGHNAFDGCNFMTVSSFAMNPPVIAGEDSFWHYGSFSNAMLKVPSPALERYRNADYWSLFPVIIGDGDLNDDGRVSMDDLTTMINCLLGCEMTNQQSLAADVNHDHRLTMDDLTMLINWLLMNNPN